MDKVLKEPPENRVIGFRQVRKAINNNRLRCVTIAMDTDIEMLTQLKSLCQQKQVELSFFSTRLELGKKLGLEVACSVCGVKKSEK
ncbi:MAG: L7Ae/L30e/S12e/Gadd45 family ribosomal protein [Bacillota bacterium]